MAAEAVRHFRPQPASNRRRVVLVVTDNMGLKKDARAVAEFWESDAVLTGVVVPGLAAMRRQRMMTPIGWFGIGGVAVHASRREPAISFPGPSNEVALPWRRSAKVRAVQ